MVSSQKFLVCTICLVNILSIDKWWFVVGLNLSLKKAQDRAHILEGLSIALDHIDEVIAVIRSSQTTEEAQNNLIKSLSLSEIQARAILAMQLTQSCWSWNDKKIEDELKELRKLIAKLEAISWLM
jgi:DNA gyrase subunit A